VFARGNRSRVFPANEKFDDTARRFRADDSRRTLHGVVGGIGQYLMSSSAM